jgi:hypothetical protein
MYTLRTSRPVKVGDWVAINGPHDKYGIVSAILENGYARIHAGELPVGEDARTLPKTLPD